MGDQQHFNYLRIAKAIDYIQRNFRTQPELHEVASYVNVSPYHLQRLFTEWAGTSPKKFLQYISVEHAKKVLKDNQYSLLETAIQTGLSGPGRLHDLFVNIEGMTPGEYKNGGENLTINYSFAEGPFGQTLIASTVKGICHMSFIDDRDKAYQRLIDLFPMATYQEKADRIQQNALKIFSNDYDSLEQIKIHLKGTAFQLKVWQALIKIPCGGLTTYGDIARQINTPKGSRAVGTAVGRNPVAFLIPCHRVIQSSGILGGYHWGNTRKAAMIGWEGAKVYNNY